MSVANASYRAPKEITIDGKVYRWHSLNIGSLCEFEQWAREQLPDPIKAIRGKLDGFSVEEKKFMLMQAQERLNRRISLASPELHDVLTSFDSVRELFYLGVKQGDPTFTREKAMEVASAADPSFLKDTVSLFDADDTSAPADTDEVKEGSDPDPK